MLLLCVKNVTNALQCYLTTRISPKLELGNIVFWLGNWYARLSANQKKERSCLLANNLKMAALYKLHVDQGTNNIQIVHFNKGHTTIREHELSPLANRVTLVTSAIRGSYE